MKQLLNKFQSFIKANKKFFFAGLALFIALFLFIFPYNDAIEKITFKALKSSPINIQYDSSSIHFFPPGISFKKIEASADFFSSPLLTGKIVIYPFYKALFALKPGVRIRIYFDKSYLDLFLRKTFASKNYENPAQIKVHSTNLPFEHLKFFSPFFINSKGVLDLFLDLTIDLKYSSQPKGEIRFKAQNIWFQPYSFTKKYLGAINLPHLKWGALAGDMKMERGKLDVANVTIGKQNDALYLQSKGFVNISWNRFGMNLKNYNLELDLRLSQFMKPQLYFVDLFLSNIEQKLDDNTVQYKAQITGQSFYPPKIKKLE